MLAESAALKPITPPRRFAWSLSDLRVGSIFDYADTCDLLFFYTETPLPAGPIDEQRLNRAALAVATIVRISASGTGRHGTSLRTDSASRVNTASSRPLGANARERTGAAFVICCSTEKSFTRKIRTMGFR